MIERYKVLLLSSLIWMGLCFVYDIPAALNTMINYGKYKNDEYKLTILYSVYALPNIILPLAFGWASTLNASIVSSFLCCLVFIGHLIFTIGISKTSFKIMILGRFLLGIGGESLSVIQNKMISCEFKGKDLSFAMGTFSSIARMGSILNFAITPYLGHHFSPSIPCLIGIILTFNGTLLCFYINFKRKSTKLEHLLVVAQPKKSPEIIKTTEIDKETKDKTEESTQIVTINENGPNLTGSEKFRSIFFNTTFEESPYHPWEGIERGSHEQAKLDLEKSNPRILYEEKNVLFFEPKLKVETGFHSSFTIIVLISFSFAIIWAPFYAIAPLLLQKRYNLSAVHSGHLLAIMEVLGLILNPVMGKIADLIGYKLVFVFIGSLTLIFSHILVYWNVASPYVVISLLGISSPMISCYWACIPNLVSENNLSKGFASVYCVLNFAFTISPILVATFATKNSMYDYVELYIISVCFVAIFLVGLLLHLNRKYSLGLNDKAEE
ncbi:Major facilitator superfamily domain-containing protein 1 [Nosema bombycis CQ1]|uniref:Lysosomal dipeptide transporter MFSD1 n=1 Tax=Nosema bombycis (strain CQ1 / CVCC 102059) TaxID=578461 RepID=R0KRI8_NOSB1|nr:Major facilitator superfamily domain-containing protein 1 [Nosema bombycis CQ1]|eukprot:EOB13361.1 Major facilitator superfamily domain-containing protein 1 [Nosema bombycis CQ1]